MAIVVTFASLGIMRQEKWEIVMVVGNIKMAGLIFAIALTTGMTAANGADKAAKVWAKEANITSPVELNGANQRIDRVVINAPRKGAVVASYSVNIVHGAASTHVQCTVTSAGGTTAGAVSCQTAQGAGLSVCAGTRAFTVSAGKSKFDLLCSEVSGTASHTDYSLTAVFVPLVGGLKSINTTSDAAGGG
jgi:hypothetical protein